MSGLSKIAMLMCHVGDPWMNSSFHVAIVVVVIVVVVVIFTVVLLLIVV